MNDAIQVKIGKLGERTVEVTLQDGATVAEALNASGVETAGYNPRLNGEAAQLTDEVQDGDVVQLLPSVKGG